MLFKLITVSLKSRCICWWLWSGKSSCSSQYYSDGIEASDWMHFLYCSSFYEESVLAPSGPEVSVPDQLQGASSYIILLIWFIPALSSFSQIFHYKHPKADVLHEDFSDRLQWQGTLNDDIQIGAVFIQNVTFNDSGTYRCTFRRTLLLPLQPENVVVEKEVELTVVAAGEQARGAGPGLSSILTRDWLVSCSQPGADGGDLWDRDVRPDRGSAAVAHPGHGLLLQEDLERTRSARGEESAGSGGIVSLHFLFLCFLSADSHSSSVSRLLESKDHCDGMQAE